MTMQNNIQDSSRSYEAVALSGFPYGNPDRWDLYDFSKTESDRNRLWFFPSIIEGRKFQNYYDGLLTGLLQVPPTMTNGLALFKGTRATGNYRTSIDPDGNVTRVQQTQEFDETGSITILNRFRPATDFILGELFNEWPIFQSQSSRRDDFLQKWRKEIIEQLIRAVRWRSIKGRGVLAALTEEDGSTCLMAIDPENYLPIRSIYDREKVVAHLLHQSYYSAPEPHARTWYPDRVIITRFDTRPGMERNDRAIFSRTVHSLGDQLTPWQPAGVLAVGTFGYDRPDYRQIEELVRELTLLSAALNRTTFRNAEPIIQRPSSQADIIWERTQHGSIVDGPTEGDREGWKVLDTSAYTTKVWEAISQKETQLARLTKVPASVYGVDDANHSAVALEELHLAAVAEITSRRDEINHIIPLIYDGLGAPAGDTEITWPRSPLKASLARDVTLMQEVEKGLITRNEWRILKGLPESKDPMADKLLVQGKALNQTETQGIGRQGVSGPTEKNPAMTS